MSERVAYDDETLERLARVLRPDALSAAGLRLLAIDGRSCSGKTTLASTLAARTGAIQVHLEFLYPGWDGLQAGIDLLESSLLRPLEAGRQAVVPQWDWYAMDWSEPLYIEPGHPLIVEGVGAASRSVRRVAAASVWLELDDVSRRARALERDWDSFGPHWDHWAVQEDALMLREGLPGAADIIVDVARCSSGHAGVL